MKDRVSTKILENGAIRYGIYDEAGNLLRYEYIRPEDEPTQIGTPLCKETLLNDSTCGILGIPTTSSVSYAIMTSYLKAMDKAAVEIHCKLPNGQPAAYAKVSGLTGAANTIANENGILTTLVNIGSATIKIDGFLDLNGTAKSVNLQAGLTVITLESTVRTPTSITITSSLYDVAFSGMVDTFDVFCVGAGGSGKGGSYQNAGGGGGYTNTLLGVVADPSSRTNAIVGAGSVGTSSAGTAGGATSAFGCSAAGGAGGGDKGGNGGSGGGGGGTPGMGGSDGGNGEGVNGGSGQGATTKAFGDVAGVLYAGGGGGAGGNAGGAGGGGTGATGGVKGGNGESGKGGGGGGGFNSAGGDGGSGVILVRWRWK